MKLKKYKYKRKMIIFLMLFAILAMLSLTAVSAANHTVSGSNFNSIESTIDSSNSGDTISLGSKTYTGSGSAMTVTGNKNITIQGQSNSNRATLDANNLHGILYITEGSSVTIRYVNFVDGGNTGHALSAHGTVRIENCSFISSEGDSGSAIYVYGTAPNSIIRNCNFTNNYANNKGANAYTAGGAVCIDNADNVNITNCNFSGNKALNHGGALVIRNDAINIRITNCNFIKNQAPSGGAIAIVSSAVIISGCTFTNNTATNGYGGAIYTTGSIRSTIIGSKFTGNSAKYGGGIYNNAPLAISTSNFVSNKASANGGAIYANKNLNISGGSIKSNTANYGSGIYNVATLRISKVTISSNTAKVISISLKAPKAVKPYKTFNIYATLKTGDNILGAIYANKNANTYVNGSRKVISSATPGKTFVSTIAGKKNNIKSNSNGVATRYSKASKTNIAVKVSYSQGGKTWSTAGTIKVTSAAKKTTKIYTNKKSTTNKPATKSNPSSTTTSKGGSSIIVSFANHENAHLASLVNMSLYKVNSKKISYWNLKKNTTLTAVTDYIYKVDKNGWYCGYITSNGGVKWGTKIAKPSTAGTWFNLTYSSNKYTIGNIVDKFTYNSSEITRYFFVSVKTSINHGVYTPYVKYAYSLVSKDGKIKKQFSFFEKTTTDIYFKSSLSASKQKDFANYLKSTENCPNNNKAIKDQIIKIFNDKLSGEITSYSKSVAIFNWVKKIEKYHLHYNTWYSAPTSLNRILTKGKGATMNCADHSHLLNSMLRTVGIPAIYGNAKCRWPGGDIYPHYWSMAYIESKKSTYKWVYLDAIHNRSSYKYDNPPWTISSKTGSFYSVGDIKLKANIPLK